jgi:hypothetical protein
METAMLSSNPAPNVQIGQNGSVPAGGTTGQVLTKTTSTDYDIQWSAGGASVVPGLLYGVQLANNTTNPNTSVDFSAGSATDDALDATMILSATLTKALNAAWAVGTNQGGLDTGTKANSTWYHVFLIQRSDTGVVDGLFSTSLASPVMPTSYDRKRRVGSIRTDGSGNILAFVQNGDTFLWAAPSVDVNASTVSTAGAVLTMLIPVDVQVEGIFQSVWSGPGSTSTQVVISSPQQNNIAPTSGSVSAITLAIGATSVISVNEIRVRANTSSQIRVRASSSPAGVTLQMATLGWVDTRGRLNPQ